MWGYSEYKPIAQRKKEAEKQIAKLRKTNQDLDPVTIEGRKIVKTWWGAAWAKNLESYADYSSRIGRGSAYVKNGFVVDLKIQGSVEAIVVGSRTYNVTITTATLSVKKWTELSALCGRQIDSLEALTAGRFPKELESTFTNSDLFPSPKEIQFNCTCPDWADMCKHVAATLYAVAARFDQDPTLFFKLRGVAFEELLKKSIDVKMQTMLKNAKKKSPRIIKDADVAQMFGL